MAEGKKTNNTDVDSTSVDEVTWPFFPIPQEWESYYREMKAYYNSIPPEELAREFGLTLEEVLPYKAPEPEPKTPNTAPDLELEDLF